MSDIAIQFYIDRYGAHGKVDVGGVQNPLISVKLKLGPACMPELQLVRSGVALQVPLECS